MKRKRTRKPRRNRKTIKACAEICRLAQILGRRCKASGIDVSEIPITCEKVIESHYILVDDGSYVRRYGGKKHG